MQSVVRQLETRFRGAITDAFGIDADPLVSPSQNEKFGDYQSNAAMGLARQLKANPRNVAQQIKDKLGLEEMADEVTIAGPGFVNIRLSAKWLAEQLGILGSDPRLGVEKAAGPQRVVVDFSGPNIAKEMHVGHLRSTIIGDAIARTLEFLGHQVIRQNHIGDWGLQMGMVTWAVEHSERPLADLSQLEELYRQVNRASADPAVRQQMIQETRRLQQTPKQELKTWQQVRDLTLASAQALYQRLGVTLQPEDVRGESFYSDQYAQMIQELQSSGLAVQTEAAVGIFPPGFTNREGEKRPFVIQSRDGTYQYPTFDLAALRYRVQQLQAQRIIYTHDSRQAEHFAMLFAVAGMLGLDKTNGMPVRFEYAAFGTVLGENGKPLKTRSGENIKLAELIDEAEDRALKVVTEKNPELSEAQRHQIAHAVGVGAIKYADLSKDRVGDYVFSWDKMLAMDGNTAPYLQYAHARIRSIFRKAQVAQGDRNAAAIILESPLELALAKHILRLGETIELVARELKSHYLCNYLYELATRFSAFYENCPVIQSQEPTRSSRLALCDVTARTMEMGLDLLGIQHPDQM